MLPEIDRMKEGKSLMKKMAEIKNKIKRSAGFTLTEMLATIAILIMVSGGLATGIGLGVKQYNKLMKRSEAQILFSTIQSAVSNELAYSDSPQLLNDVKSDNSGTTKSDSTEGLRHDSTNPIAITTTSYRLKSTKYFSFFSKGDYGDDLNTYGTTSGFGQIYLGENIDNDSDEDVNLPLLGRAAYSDGLAAKVTIDEFDPKSQYFTVTVQIADLSDSSDSEPDIIVGEKFQVLRLNGVATGTASETSSKTITVPTPVPTGKPTSPPTPTPLKLIADGAKSYTILETKFAGVRFSAKAEGGSTPYTFAWSATVDGSIGTTDTQNNPTKMSTQTKLPAGGYTFTCTVTDKEGTSVSIDFSLTVIGELKIIQQPSDVTVVSGKTAEFKVEATGGESPLTYSWKDQSGTEVGTDATLTINGATANNTYTCTVTSTDGQTVTSNTVKLTVLDQLTVTAPESVTVAEGNTATFSVTASGGAGNYSYQWYKDGTAIRGANSNSYTTSAATSSMNGSKYYCQVTDSAGTSYSQTVNSSEATLTVVTKLSVTISQTAGTNGAVVIKNETTDTASLTATPSGGSGKYEYQWYGPEGLISGATGKTYIADGSSKTGNYYCIVTSSDGQTATSNSLTLKVVTVKTTKSGSNAIVDVSGGSSVKLQWQYKKQILGSNWTDITGWGDADEAKYHMRLPGYLYRCKITVDGITIYSDEIQNN